MNFTGTVGRFKGPKSPFFLRMDLNLSEGQGTYLSKCRGTSSILSHITGVFQKGTSRVATMPGYNVYVGVNQMPSFATRTAFSASLPIVYTITPPGSGQTTFYVVVRKVNAYGLESQNQKPTLIVVNSLGQQVLPPVNAPVGIVVPSPITINTLRVLANYPQLAVDQYPADHWKVWIKSTPPNVGVDTPVYNVKVGLSNLMVDLSTYTPGTWYYAVGLYRTVDSSLSTVLSGSVVYPSAPVTPEAVPSLYAGS